MARGPNEKNFSADIPDHLAEEAEQFISSHRNVKKKELLRAALELFLDLQPEHQQTLLFEPRSAPRFDAVVQQSEAALASASTTYVLLSPEEQRQVQRLRELLGPEEFAQRLRSMSESREDLHVAEGRTAAPRNKRGRSGRAGSA